MTYEQIRKLITKNKPLPAGLTSIGGFVDLRGYGHALPAALTNIWGFVYLENYGHALPAALTVRRCAGVAS